MIKMQKRGLKVTLGCAVAMTTLLSVVPGSTLTTPTVEAYGERADGSYYYAETTLYDYKYDREVNTGFQYNYDNQYTGGQAAFNEAHSKVKGDRWHTGNQVPYEMLNRKISEYYAGQSSPGLYFGNFFGTATDNDKGFVYDSNGNQMSNYNGQDPQQYTYGPGSDPNRKGTWKTYNEVYNNFWITANNAPKVNSGNVAVQGLVDKTLTNGAITQNGRELPQFSDSFINSNNNLITKYPTTSGFPFNITRHENGTTTYSYDSANDAKRYYKDGEILVGPDGSGTSNFRSEGTVTAGRTGFFPFNEVDITNTFTGREEVNYGFGMQTNISFNLNENGTLVDKYGNEHDAIFNFSGDDDIWVFVDGVLVLDMGGDHARVAGEINFNREKNASTSSTVQIDHAGTFVNGGSRTTRIGSESSFASNLPTMFSNAGVSFDADSFYNPETEHVLTIFYMERGMFESNLSISFNFAPLNPHRLTVKEVTEFDNINPGLLKQTVAVADKDIFDYSIENAGTAANDVAASGLYAPTYDYIDRRNTQAGNNLLNRLSGQPEEYTQGSTVMDADNIYLNTAFSGGDWSVGNAVIMAWVWQTGGSGHYVRLQRDEATGYYKLPRGNYNNMRLRRFNPSNPAPDGGTTYNVGQVWNETGDLSISTSQNLFNMSGWTAGSWSNTTVMITTEPALVQHSNPFTPIGTGYNAVADTTYRLTDPMGVATNTTTSQTTLNRDTTDDGHFRLMYGEDAFFNAQFKKGSTMRVKQGATLYQPKANRATNMGADPGTRAVSTYYNTRVYVVDVEDREVLSKSQSEFAAYNSDGTYTFQNHASTDKSIVHLKETYINTVKVGAVKIRKELTNSETGSQAFTFRLTLSRLFGDTTGDGVITDYSGVEIYIDETKTYLNEDGTFTLPAGKTAYIEGIPVETQYSIVEVDSGSNFEIDTTSSQRQMTNASGTIKESTVANTTVDLIEVNKRKTGGFTVTKTITGDGANTSDAFPVTVVLTPPDGVDLSDYLISESVNVASKTKITDFAITANGFTFTVTDESSITFQNIPYGTTYTVRESAGEYTSSIVYEDEYKLINDEGDGASVNITNTKTLPDVAKIKVIKVDNYNNPVEGASFAIYSNRDDAVAMNSNTVADATLSVNGNEFTFGNLTPNTTYYIAEIETPDNYIGLSEPLEVTTDGKETTKEVRAVNTQIEIVMPETGASWMLHPAVFGAIVLTLSALALMIYRKKLQKVAAYTDDNGEV